MLVEEYPDKISWSRHCLTLILFFTSTKSLAAFGILLHLCPTHLKWIFIWHTHKIKSVSVDDMLYRISFDHVGCYF